MIGKRGLLAAAALIAFVALAAAMPRPAQARVFLSFGFGGPLFYGPVYAPPPVYFAPRPGSRTIRAPVTAAADFETALLVTGL